MEDTEPDDPAVVERYDSYEPWFGDGDDYLDVDDERNRQAGINRVKGTLSFEDE